MTAVEQFFKDLCDLGFIEYPDDSLIQDRYNLTLEMEKQQIIDAHLTGLVHTLEMEATKQAEQYYNDTFGDGV